MEIVLTQLTQFIGEDLMVKGSGETNNNPKKEMRKEFCKREELFIKLVHFN